MTDDIPYALCPITGCTGQLYLTISSCIPLYTQEPPWPGAGVSTYGANEAVSQGWEVVCTEGHTIWNHTDQIRATNATGDTDEMDETTDYAPPFRFDVLSAALLTREAIA